jgi:tripartite-type tricarboxylate transporter receptor subunit TctC
MTGFIRFALSIRRMIIRTRDHAVYDFGERGGGKIMVGSLAAVAARAVFVLALCASGAWAQGYPDRPVRLIVGFAAGGTTDVVARLVAQKLTPLLGQQVLVENKPGAGGVVGTDFVAKAAPDGYTLLMATAGHATAAAIMRKVPFDPVQGFAFISTVTTYPFIISTSMNSQFKSLADVVTRVRAEPGKVTYATAGVGSSGHFLGEWFSDALRLDLVHIPFKGGSAAMSDVITGRIDLMIEPVISTLPHVKAGKLRALAVTSPQAASYLPEVPPAVQLAPDYVFQSWVGVAAPAGTPPAILERLNRDIRRVLMDSDVQKQLADIGAVAAPSSPEQMRAQVTAEVERWRRLVSSRQIEQQ